ALFGTRAIVVPSFAFGALESPARLGIDLALCFIPCALVNSVCSALSQPVISSVRGADWTAADLARQSAWAQAATSLPLIAAGVGVTTLVEGPARTGIAFLVLAYAARVLSIRQLRLALDFWPQSLTRGTLRDRIF